MYFFIYPDLGYTQSQTQRNVGAWGIPSVKTNMRIDTSLQIKARVYIYIYIYIYIYLGFNVAHLFVHFLYSIFRSLMLNMLYCIYEQRPLTRHSARRFPAGALLAEPQAMRLTCARICLCLPSSAFFRRKGFCGLGSRRNSLASKWHFRIH